jgi:hypothetical protein
MSLPNDRALTQLRRRVEALTRIVNTIRITAVYV